MRVLMLILITAFILPSYQIAQACECKPPGDVAQEYPKANLIFSGEVVELNAHKVALKVSKMWKGESVGRITLRVDSPCSFSFKLGERYLVYTMGSGRAKAHVCSRTKLLEGAEEEIKELEGFSRDRKNGQARRSAQSGAKSNNGMHPTRFSEDVIR